MARRLSDIGQLLRNGQNRLNRALRTSGPGKLLLAFDYLLSKADTIRSPARYFDKMVATKAGAFSTPVKKIADPGAGLVTGRRQSTVHDETASSTKALGDGGVSSRE